MCVLSMSANLHTEAFCLFCIYFIDNQLRRINRDLDVMSNNHGLLAYRFCIRALHCVSFGSFMDGGKEWEKIWESHVTEKDNPSSVIGCQ